MQSNKPSAKLEKHEYISKENRVLWFCPRPLAHIVLVLDYQTFEQGRNPKQTLDQGEGILSKALDQ